ncbi:hypothetical protein OAQ99_00410 [Candidatus Kapabacteria bacterium]|nr:hypothetical protein [Candidatus Kapabacteria bacterium]
MAGGNKHAKIGFVQYFLALVMIIGVAVVAQKIIVPWGASSFVLPLFEPTGDEREKIGFVEFQADQYVWGSTSLEVQEELGNESAKGIEKEYINGEFIFDFSGQARETKVHGYSNVAGNYYIKAPKLGESAIIIEPLIAFSILSFVIGFIVMVIVTILLPPAIGLMSALFSEQIHHVQTNIRLQTGFSNEIVDILTLPGKKLEQVDRERIENAFRVIWSRSVTEAEKGSDYKVSFDDVWDDDTDVVFFRDNAIYQRIKEFFSEFVEVEINNTKEARIWTKNKFQIFKGLKLYMAQHFSHHYSNKVTGLAYAGAAFLIIAVGIRGLKFIPAAKPSIIMGAILLEFSLLSLMAVTLLYTQEEERTDKMLKRMEDSNRSQLEALKGQSHDINTLANALVGQSSDIIKAKVENTISEYLTSGKEVNSQIASAIADKIVFDVSGKK